MSYESILQEQLDSLQLGELENIMSQASEQTSGIFSNTSVSEIVSNMVSGKQLVNTDTVLSNLSDLFLSEVKAGLILGVEIISICIVVGLLKSMSNSFGEKPVSALGTMICSALVIMLCLKNFTCTYEACLETVDTMTDTMLILLPILIPLLVSMGGLASGGVLNPVIAGAITVFNTVLKDFILPLVFVSSIFVLINGLTEKNYVKKLAGFLRRTAIFCTGLAVTVFAGLTAVQGLVTKSADGLLANTARYSADNFIPIVGKFAADSVDMVISCIGVIKNGVGLLGVIIIVSLLTIPIVKALAIAVIYKLTAIVAEPLGDKNISDCLNEMGSSVITMTVVLALSGLMFLIFLTILIGMGGGALWRQ